MLNQLGIHNGTRENSHLLFLMGQAPWHNFTHRTWLENEEILLQLEV